MSWFKSKSSERTGGVPVKEKFAYGLRAFSQQLGSNGMTMFAFPAYGMILGLDPALIGIVFALMRLYDAVTDPLVGWLSDNTRSRWGRRKPYMFIGALLGGLAFALLWQASAEWSDVMKTAYFVGMSLLFYTCYTVMVIPGDALGWELTSDYSERTRVMSWFSVTVKITLLIMPWMFALTQSDLWASEQQGLRVVGALFGLLFALTGIVPALVCKERNFEVASKEGKPALRETLMLTLKNRNCLLVYGIALMALFAGQTYMLFGTHLAVYYLFDGAKVAGAKFFGVFGTLAAPIGLLAIASVNRFFIEADKRKVLIGALGIALFGWISALFLITPAFPWLMLVPVCMNAIGVAVFWLLLGSVLADVADEDELKTGCRREGSIAAFSSFLCKAAGTLGAVLGGILLSRSGFDADAAQQAPEVLSSIKGIYVGFPLVGYSGALLFAWHYPLTRDRMIEVRAELERRRGLAGE